MKLECQRLPASQLQIKIGMVTAAACAGALAGALMVMRWGGGQSTSVHSPRDVFAALHAGGISNWMIAAMALWVPLGLYWEVAAKKAAERVQSEAFSSRLFHVSLVVVSQLLLFVPVPGLRERFIPDWIVTQIAGLSIEAAGVGLAIWSRRLLGRNWSDAIATNVGHELVRTGPYKWIRHPIYTGLLGLYLGTGLVSGEMHALLGIVIVSGAYWRKIRMEEAHLKTVFGWAYDEYRGASWALIPGVV